MAEHYIKEDILKILRLLASKDDLSQRDLSSHIGISLGKTNYLLKSLVTKDLIKIKNFISKNNKIAKVRYYLTKKGWEEKTNLVYHFLKQKEREYYALKGEVESYERDNFSRW